MVINKKTNKIYKSFGFWNCFCFLYNLIIRNYCIINNTSYVFTIFTTTCSRIPNIIFSHTWCSFKLLHSHQHLSFFYILFDLYFLPSALHLYLHDIYFVNVIDSFIPVIMLKILRYKSPILFQTHLN